MKKHLLLVMVLLFAVSCIFAASVDTFTADRVARNFVLERLGTDYSVVSLKKLDTANEDSYIYVVNLNPKGFVLIAADDAATPILGFSTSNNWKEFEMPIQLEEMLHNWNGQLRTIVTRKLSADLPTAVLWGKYNRDAMSFEPNRNTRSVSPLITSIWGQGTYYNALCPSGTPVGCVATAMAQIMRYWAFPSVGQGSNSYNCPPYGVQSADFGATTYNWAAMPNALNNNNSSVATICRHAGVSVNMDYAPDGSGAYSTDVPAALINNFKYKSTTQYLSRGMYSASNWDTIIKGELDNARPVYYSGSSAGSGGHAFIVDGYTGTYPSATYHINWGWYGYYNGYFALASLNPGTDDFNSNQAAVVGIEPSVNIPLLSETFDGTTFPPTDWTRSHTSWTRTTTSTYIITGTASAMNSGTGNQNGRRLVTPKLSVDGTVPITFKGKRGTGSYSEAITVQYSTDGTSWTSLSTYSLTATATLFTQSLASLSPGDYYIGFLTANATTVSTQTKRFIIDDVTGPQLWINPVPIAAINISSWAAGSTTPGEAIDSGPIFQLSNIAGGTLQIQSITNLSGTEFTTTINPGVQLITGQIHEFGFTYEPLVYGSANQSFQIVTNGGTINITLTGSALYAVLTDGFESYTDFALSFPPWTQRDGDGFATYTVTNVTFTNQGYTGSYILFNPSMCNPSQVGTALEAHGGDKLAACFAGTSAPNNDWLISPELTLGATGTLRFWAKSYTDQYGLERFKVLTSTTTNVYTSFTTYLAGSASTYVSAPVTWTEYTYTLPQNVKYFAIQCVSNDAFIFMVDDVMVTDSSTPPPPQFGNLSGYVYRYGTSTPIANAKVAVGTKSAYTDATGFYQINNLVVNSYTANCTTPGMFYFGTSASGIAITQGNTTNQNFYLTWAELAVNPTSISASVYSSETALVPMTIANPGGTADLQYEMFFSSASSARNGIAHTRRLPAEVLGEGYRFEPQSYPATERAEGWMSYTDPADADFYSYPVPERATKFTLEHFGMYAQGVTISKLRHYFYEPTAGAWSGNNTYTLKIYAADGTTVLYTSPSLTATNWPAINEHILTAPITVTGDFYVAVVPVDATNGAPFSIGTSASVGHSYGGSAGAWTLIETLDLILMAYIDGSEWVEASQYSGTVAPGATHNIDVNFDSTGLAEGTHSAYLHIYNNANYVAPSPNPTRGDVMVVPVSLTVTIPTSPTATLNKTSWTTVAETGSPSSSGNVFQLKNVGTGNLTISSVTGLSGTPFTSNINTGISLAINQTHDFGFTFTPVSNGIYNATVQIVTNGGTKTVTLKGYANYLAEGFEGSVFPPDGWVSSDVDADTYNWMRYTATGAANTGEACAGSASFVNDTRNQNNYKTPTRGALTPDNWLITPRLTITNGDELSFWIAAQDPEWPAEYYSVKLSTTTNAIASFTTTLLSETLSDGDWHLKTINLSAYAGQSVYIAFQHHNCTDQFVLKLDDVLLPPLAAPLVFGNISGVVRKYGSTTPVVGASVAVASRNATTDEYGAYTISNIVVDTYPLTASATGYMNYSANVSIPANSTLTHDIYLSYAEVYTASTTFSTDVNVGGSTTINVQMTNTGNSTLSFETASGVWGGDIFPAGLLNETWEDNDLTGWTGSVGPNSDIYSGNYGYTTTPYTWVFNSYETTSVQYIISPKLRVVSGDNLTFGYKQFNASSETFEVRVSTTDNNIASFTTFASVGPLDDTNWTLFNQSLNAYAGQDIYVCFYYPRTDGYQYGYILIDDITGPTMLASPTDWLSCTPVGYPVAETLGAGQSRMLNLSIDASELPVGTFTAQTWIFSDGLLSPYKLYITANVVAATAPDAPVVSGIESFPGGLYIGWDEVDNATLYRVYGCTEPNGTYSILGTTDATYLEFTDAQLATFGLTDRGFFKVTADSAARSLAVKNQAAKTPSQPLQKSLKPNTNRKLVSVK